MTISSATDRYSYSGAGSAGPFTITDLEITADTQLSVTRTDSSGNTTLIKDAGSDGYSVDQASAPFTSITLTEVLASGETLTILLDVPNTQGTDYVENDSFAADTHESALDKLTLIAKQQTETLNRSVKFTEETTATNVDVPNPTGNGDKYLKLNAGATDFEYSTLSVSSGLGNVVEDLTPQLGGDLDTNGNDIDVKNGDNLVLKGASFDTTIDKATPTAARTVTLPDATDTLVGKATTDTLTNKTIDADNNTLSNIAIGAECTGASTDLTDTAAITYNADTSLTGNGYFLDEDTLSSDDATKVASQQSIKAYVDSTYLAGQTVQVLTTLTSAVSTGTTAIPADDSIPQLTEGTQFMSRGITPTSGSNKLLIEVILHGSHSAVANLSMGLFRDSTSDALASSHTIQRTATDMAIMTLSHEVSASSTSATTFIVKAGGDQANTFTFNGKSGARVHGGVLSSSIIITEIQV